jgi:hypothetical protein
MILSTNAPETGRERRQKMKYRGIIIDRLSSDHRWTRYYMTWEAAHHAAERMAKRIGHTGDRYRIDVDTI